jgi:hemerythrin-like domain-containing protein
MASASKTNSIRLRYPMSIDENFHRCNARRVCRADGPGYARRTASTLSEVVVNDPIAILKRDHREAAALLKQLSESKPGATRRRTTNKVVAALQLHMAIEEELLYPLVKERIGTEEEQEAENEHDLARAGLDKMSELVDSPGFGAAVAMTTAGIKHHVKEEETEVFPELKSKLDRDELAELGDAVAARKRKRRSRAA